MLAPVTICTPYDRAVIERTIFALRRLKADINALASEARLIAHDAQEPCVARLADEMDGAVDALIHDTAIDAVIKHLDEAVSEYLASPAGEAGYAMAGGI